MGLLVHFVLKCLLFSVLSHLLTQCLSSTHQPCLESERSALLQFKESFILNQSTSGYAFAYSKVSSWELEGESGGDCCTWDGVECDDKTGHVVGLDLSSSFLYGSIDSNNTLFQLHHLTRLNLSDNHFNGSKIPSAIGNLKRLSQLDLSFSAFAGQIPSQVLELSKLVILDLSRNGLQLKNPSLKSLAERLENLEYLNLDEVNLSSTVPQSLANLSYLTYLSLKSCELHGEFPIEVFQLPNLQFLHASFNTLLTGRLPEFSKNTCLVSLRLAGTSFSGDLPESIGNLNSLSHLNIENCYISGRIPTSLTKLTELAYLSLAYNEFNPGTLSWIGNLTKLSHLDVSGCSLSGQIPNSLTNLTELTYLSLAENEFTPGTLSWLGKLTKLIVLDVDSTNSYGGLPSSLKNLTSLEVFGLHNNQFSNQIPYWLGNLTRLIDLNLGRNQFSGSIPESIFTLKNLEYLTLYGNRLIGDYELEPFLNLKNLKVLQLSANEFSLLNTPVLNVTVPKFDILTLGSCNLSDFPDFLLSQDELTFLGLWDNKIRGLIPKWIWGLSAQTLEVLYLGGNFLTGLQQPSGVAPWTNLRELDLSSNKLQGALPIPPASIYRYFVSNNLLEGKISSLICNLPSITTLDISSNSFSGMLPQCLGNLSKSLIGLNLQNNNFRGPIPETCEEGSALRMIDLSRNQFNGHIPRSLVNCNMLQHLNLGNNQVEDMFPSWLGRLPDLRVLILRHNKFHGAIGKSKAKEFPKLRILDLSFNVFQGSLPYHHFQGWQAMKAVDLGKLNYLQADVSFEGEKRWDHNFSYSMTMTKAGVETIYDKIQDILVAIDLSSNQFEGVIPEDIRILKAVQFLNLSNNFFSGPIPSSLANLTNLQALDLSHNKLSGEIPQELVQLTFLGFFNVSHNQLIGPIPQGKQFGTFENNSFEANPGLCGKPLSKKCFSEGSPPPPPPPSSSKQDDGGDSWLEFGWRVIMLGFGVGLLNGLILGYLFNPMDHWLFVKYFGWKIQTRRRRKRN